MWVHGTITNYNFNDLSFSLKKTVLVFLTRRGAIRIRFILYIGTVGVLKISAQQMSTLRKITEIDITFI